MTASNAVPFGFVPIDPRRSSTKPRRTGLSMVIDDGLPLPYLRGALELAAPYIDLIKIKTGTARLYPRDQLVAKLKLCEEFEVEPFLGGQFHEYVFAKLGEESLPRFYAEALVLGFRTIDISDNTVPLSDDQRRSQIRLAVAAGLKVFGEVG
ncbi:MAG TPA: phosphosulfolactate synthase, partial [Reyranellaceae bacterium]|nr:phosphosulfolactate synthase [Reyranellaceae bacterium]